MTILTTMKMIVPLMAAVLVAMTFLIYKEISAQESVSELGKYQGYSLAVYDGTRRLSDYLTLSDGTRLAYDLILPTQNGVPAGRPLPVLFKYTPYLRTYTLYDKTGKNMVADLYRWSKEEQDYVREHARMSDRGPLLDPLLRNRYLGKMVKCGYAVIVVERPGTGASFGRSNPTFEALAKEANDILNWIAAQPWSDGNIGMYGDSWQGQTQLAAASTGNPHLKTIVPAGTWMDNYNAILYPGGVLNKAFIDFFVWTQKILSSEVVTPVDRDRDGALLAQARQERAQAGLSMGDFARMFPFRDSALPNGMKPWIDAAAAYPYLERINRSGIPIYLVTGWFDLCTRDMLLWYANLTGPKRLLIRPLDHSQVDTSQSDLDYAAEIHRWFDYWLKGIDNGIMKEAPVHYYLQQARGEKTWQTSWQWPLESQKTMSFYLGQGKTGTIASVNDGLLIPEISTAQDAFDQYTVDYTTTTGEGARWTAVNWPRQYPDMGSNDRKALTYSTAPLERGMELTGHPVARLWLTTDAPDLDAFVYLEEVDSNGRAAYVTEGNLRASHRQIGQAPFRDFGLPYHSHYKSDLAPIPTGQPCELVFDLLPTSYRFQEGNRIRITVAFADAENFETPIINPAPNVRVLRDRNHPSMVQLPVVRSR